VTTARIALVLAASFAASDLRAQTDTLVPPSAYAARRTKLARAVGNAAIIVPGRHLVGQHELPRQDADFWYLTGVESPYAVLVMSGGRTALFLPDTFEFAGAQFPLVDSEAGRGWIDRYRADWQGLVAAVAPSTLRVPRSFLAEVFRA